MNIFRIDSEFDTYQVLKLVKCIHQTHSSIEVFKDDLIIKGKSNFIKLAINTPDSEMNLHSILDVIPAVDYILQSKISIYSEIEGMCNFFALLVHVVCFERTMHKDAFINLGTMSTSGGLWGNASSQEDEIKNMKLIKNMVKKILINYTKMPQKMIANLFLEEYLLDSKEALKFGLIDKII